MSPDEWKTQEPSPGFAERVMVGIEEETAGRRGASPSAPKLRGRVAGAVALAALVAL